MTELGLLPAASGGRVYDISADGSIIVGTQVIDRYSRAVRWVDGVPEFLLLPENPYSGAHAVSADQTVIVIHAHLANHGCYCRRSGTSTMLLPLPPDPIDTFTWVEDISADGSTAVGETRREPVSWNTVTGNPTPLGLLPGRSSGVATAVSADGSVIIGSCSSCYAGPGCKEGFVWDEEHGMRSLNEVLFLAGLATAISGWELYEVNGVSDDGKVIVGKGTTPGGIAHAWLADLRWPPPSDACENAQPLGWGAGSPVCRNPDQTWHNRRRLDRRVEHMFVSPRPRRVVLLRRPRGRPSVPRYVRDGFLAQPS